MILRLAVGGKPQEKLCFLLMINKNFIEPGYYKGQNVHYNTPVL